MSFDADIRAGYMRGEINRSWIDLIIEEKNLKLIFKNDGENISEKTAELNYYDYIENKMMKFIIHRIFNNETHKEMNYYDDIWSMVIDATYEYASKHNSLIIKDLEEEDLEEEGVDL